MMIAILWAIEVNEGGEYGHGFEGSWVTFYIKIPCSIALHFFLTPKLELGMKIMKLANNQPELFVEGGSQSAFILGFISYISIVVAELINVWLLAY